jgi:hypothetical protein
MFNWLISILNSFVVIHGDKTVAMGHEGMLVSSQSPFADDNGARLVPAF